MIWHISSEWCVSRLRSAMSQLRLSHNIALRRRHARLHGEVHAIACTTLCTIACTIPCAMDAIACTMLYGIASTMPCMRRCLRGTRCGCVSIMLWFGGRYKATTLYAMACTMMHRTLIYQSLSGARSCLHRTAVHGRTLQLHTWVRAADWYREAHQIRCCIALWR